MKITVIPGDRLTGEHVALWSRLQHADPRLDSPYFRPEFAQAVATVRDDVAVGVLEEGNRIVGFFPFQRGRWGIGRPAGTPLSDFQGVVARPDAPWDAEQLVRGCGLAAWRFGHLLADQQPFRPYHRATVPSPFIDLSRGFEAYEEDLRRAGSQRIRRVRRKARKAERRVGPLRFEFHTADSRVFQKLLEWKTLQYRRTKYTNIFGFPWVVRLLEHIRDRREAAFSGVLSALYMGDRLAAVHLGMRSCGVLHRWFPAYDRALAPYCPGQILLVEMARTAASLGVRRIDRGKGMEWHKTSFMSGTVLVAEGTVTCGPMARTLDHARRSVGRLAKTPVVGGPARLAAALTRQLRRQWMYR